MIRQKIKKITVRNKSVSRFKLPESYTSLILGAIVVLVVGILFFSLAKGNRTTQTSSVSDSLNAEKQISQDNTNTSSTYTIKPGDDLWSISEDVYKDGYKWVEIAKVNNLQNPGLIHVGNKLTILTVLQKKPVEIKPEVSPNATDKIIRNNSIVENTYSIKPGDNLWEIAVRAYGDGFKWPELARANNISNPDLIYPDNVLKIPR